MQINSAKIILIRHGQSHYNKENKFTGIIDSPLTQLGLKQAENCAAMLQNINIDISFSSNLTRAKATQNIILEKQTQTNITKHQDQALNERDYGDLSGLNKDEAVKKYGEKQIEIWRRGIKSSPPQGESLQNTIYKAGNYYDRKILPWVKENKNILIASHGNTIRALITHIYNVTEDKVPGIEIGWCEPWVITLKNAIPIHLEIIKNTLNTKKSNLPENAISTTSNIYTLTV